jgi:hypothetical protein
MAEGNGVQFRASVELRSNGLPGKIRRNEPEMNVGLFMIAIIGFALTVVPNELERVIIPWTRD